MTKNLTNYFFIIIFTFLIIPITVDAYKYTTFSNGTEIYFNPETGLKCSKEEYENNLDASKTENKQGCMKWYIFLDDENSRTVDMLLDHNTTATSNWSSTNKNDTNADALIETLQKDTKDWKEDLNPRIITAQEFVEIVNPEFDINEAVTGDKVNLSAAEGWLIDRISECRSYSGKICYNDAVGSKNVYGYWTLTQIGKSHVWYVYRNGYMGTRAVDNVYYGVRPVITVDKSIIAYNVLKDIENGKIETNLEIAKENEEITFSVTANEGYEIEQVKVLDDNGVEIETSENQFEMPNRDVTITAKLKEIKIEVKEEIEENPKTNDYINNYIITLMFSLLVVIGVIVIKNKKYN